MIMSVEIGKQENYYLSPYAFRGPRREYIFRVQEGDSIQQKYSIYN